MKEKISIKDERLNISINEDEQYQESTISTFKDEMADGLQEQKELTDQQQLDKKEELEEKISSDYAVVKKDELSQPKGGSVPAEPKTVPVEKKTEALKTEDEKTYDSIVKAWEDYSEKSQYDQFNTLEQKIASLKSVVSASDKYSSWRFTLFMKASNPKYQRIMHAKEIYNKSKAELAELLEIQKKNNEVTKNAGKSGEIEYIHSDDLAWGAYETVKKAGIFKGILARVTGTIHWAAANIGSLLTSPFRKKTKETMTDRKKGRAGLGDYWVSHVNFYNRVFGERHTVYDLDGEKSRVSVSYASREARENSKTMKQDNELINEEIGVTDVGLIGKYEDALDDYDVAYDLGEKIIEELKKKSPDMAKIKKWRKELSEKKINLLNYNNNPDLDEYPEVKISKESMDELIALEYEGQKQEISRLDVFKRKIPMDKIHEAEGQPWTQLVATEQKTIMSEEWVKKEWIQKGKMPASVVEKKIKEVYRDIHGEDSEIPKEELEKRKAEFQKKFDESIYAAKCLHTYWYTNIDNGAVIDSAYYKKLKDDHLPQFTRDLKSFTFMEPNEEIRNKDFHEFVFGHDYISNDGVTDEEQRKENDRKNAESKAARLGILRKYVDKYLNFKPEDLKKYEYSTREEMLTKFARYSDELSSGMTAGATFNNYIAYGGKVTEQEEIKFRMVQLFLEEVKSTVEVEIRIMMNPYELFMDSPYLESLNWDQLNELRKKPGETVDGDNAAGETYDLYMNYREIKVRGASTYDGKDCIKTFESFRKQAESITAKKIKEREQKKNG